MNFVSLVSLGTSVSLGREGFHARSQRASRSCLAAIGAVCGAPACRHCERKRWSLLPHFLRCWNGTSRRQRLSNTMGSPSLACPWA